MDVVGETARLDGIPTRCEQRMLGTLATENVED